jgi:nucleoside 2-deoxyribosyltransferase
MKIYFACSITGGREEQPIYQKLVDFLLDLGHDVPTAIIAETGIEQIDAVSDPIDIYQRDVNWIRDSHILIAEISTPSHGVGYEIGYALDLGKPVLCLHKADVKVSKMIIGNPHPKLRVESYKMWGEIERILNSYFTEAVSQLGD